MEMFITMIVSQHVFMRTLNKRKKNSPLFQSFKKNCFFNSAGMFFFLNLLAELLRFRYAALSTLPFHHLF